MKKISIAVLGIFLLALTPSFAQFSVGINGSAAFSDVQNSKTIYGGGLNAKIFLGSKLDVGIGVKAFGESRSFSAAGQTLEYSAAIIPITALIDYYFTEGVLRPYVGAEVGAYSVGTRIKFNGQESSKINSTNAGVAPKVGLMLAVGNLGIFAEGAYNIIFGNNDGSASVGTIGNVNFDQTSKFFTVNVGLQIGIPKMK
ncbi:hypothetical protein [Spirosoma jeollabukense]